MKNKQSGKEVKNRVPFTRTTKRIKYTEINLTKEVKDLYTENYKTSLKEMEKDTNSGRDNVVQMLILFTEVDLCRAISTKILVAFFAEPEKKSS